MISGLVDRRLAGVLIFVARAGRRSCIRQMGAGQ